MLFDQVVQTILMQLSCPARPNGYHALFDYCAREIVVVSKDGTMHYPYPENIATFTDVATLDGCNSLLLAGSPDYSSGDEPYIFNLQTGVLTAYQPLCGENSPIRPDPVWDVLYADWWVLDVRPEGISLCATMTDERTPPLPLPEGFTLSPLHIPSMSPDEKHAIIAGANGEIYAYDFEDAQITPLGICDLCADWGFLDSEWSSDSSYIAIYQNDDSQCVTYAADVTAANSLACVFESVPDCARMSPGSAQIVQWAYPVWKEGSPPTHCTETIYYAAAGTRDVHDFGRLCQPDYGDYYRDVANDRSSADVLRIDPVTGERKTIYAGGEIEFVPWVSADERFAVLLLDDSGQITYLPGEVASSVWIDHPRFALVDLTTGSTLYEKPLKDSIISEVNLVCLSC